jgi:hypothetical protein
VQKVMLLKIVNPAVGIVFLVQALSGILHSVIPWEVFHAWHGPLGYALVALIFAHVYLNWTWINTNYFKKKNKIVKNKTDSKTITISKEA